MLPSEATALCSSTKHVISRRKRAALSGKARPIFTYDLTETHPQASHDGRVKFGGH